MRLVADRIGGRADRFGVSERGPQLLGDVRGEGGEQHGQRFEHFALRTLAQLVEADHKGRHGGVEREVFDVLRDLLDGLVEGAQLLLGRLFVRDAQLPVAVEEQAPEAAQEFVHAVDAVRVPGFGLFQRA